MTTCVCGAFAAVPRTWPEVTARMAIAERIRPALILLAANGQTWMRAYRCAVCSQTWASELPHSEHHGGGPELLYRIDATDPVEWLGLATPISAALRQDAEDQQFFEALGPEVGPERCREPGCQRLRINPGLYCRCHHFEMVMHRRCPFWQPAAAR